MATAKKTSVKKPVAAKAAPKKTAVKTTTSKPAAKKTVHHSTAKKSAPAAAKHRRLVSLSIAPEDKPFFTFSITRQTLYWLIFSVTILALGLWVLNLNIQVLSLYDQIENTNAQTSLNEPKTPSIKAPTVKK
jgi:hypothetical protein